MNNNNAVNWSVFDIDPYKEEQDVTKRQVLEQYAKYSGTPKEFAKELARRFEYSGAMCELVIQWIKDKC